MGRWLVTQDSVQFSVESLEELLGLARGGKLDAGDMVQPPGATDWLYASEVPELGQLFESQADADLDDLYPRRSGGLGKWLGVAALLALVGAGGAAMYVYGQQVFGDQAASVGEGDLSYSRMLVTEEGASLWESPDRNSKVQRRLPKDASLTLLAKRGDFYRARTDGGLEGWVATDAVLPLYLLGGGEVREEYDPLYNPDQYLTVPNASWLALDKNNERLTVFRVQLENASRYPMTDVVLLATIKDGKGTELERVEMVVEGVVPALGTTMVGTLHAPEGSDAPARTLTQHTLDDLAEGDPDLRLRFSDGVEVELSHDDFTEANIDFLEVRAIPEAG